MSLPDKVAEQRALQELPLEGVIGPETTLNESAEFLDQYAKGLVQRTRGLLYALAPVLYYYRQYDLWNFHPEHFGSFADWLAQPELDMKPDKATQIIDWWLYAVPQCEAAGISVDHLIEHVPESKMALITRKLKNAASTGQPLDTGDVQKLVYAAETMPFRDLSQFVRAGGDEEKLLPDDPLVEFTVVRTEKGQYRITAVCDEETMRYIAKRLRPTWTGPDGRILEVQVA